MSYIPIVPSSLLNLSNEESNALKKNYNDFSLKTGVIVKTYPIDDKNNVSKKDIEYDVLTVSQDGNKGTSTVIYKKCLVMEGFGSKADFFEHTLRQPEKDLRKEKEPHKDTGSTVLLLCVNGNQDNGIIIGKIRNSTRKTTLTKDAGHHLEGEFNGVNWKIDKDGALTIKFKSATDSEGNPQDEKAGGTFLEINKEGSVDINTSLSGEEETYINMDKPNKDIALKAGNKISLTSKKDTSIDSGNNLDIKTKKDLIAMCEGKASFDVKQSFDIKAESKFSLEAQQIMAKSKSMIQFQAQSMFQAKASSSAIIEAPQVLLGPSPSQPAVLAFQLITLGTGNLGAPIISNLIAGFSTSVLLSS